MLQILHALLGGKVVQPPAPGTPVSIAANFATTGQTYLGGYIEIQPDSYNGTGTIPATDGSTDVWGFPYSLTSAEQTRLRNLVMPGGGKKIQFLRFPLGFAYRGFRNIDGTTGLAKNIGPRYSGQDSTLTALIASVVGEGGGLAPEYWAPPPYWLTKGVYGNTNGVLNALWAGGSYPRATKLDSIRTTDPTQYSAQIGLFTDAIINDFEYLHANVGPVRMYALQNEPDNGGAAFGGCNYTNQLYGDVLTILQPKIEASTILSTYGGQANVPKLHMASTSAASLTMGTAYATANPSKIWSFVYHNISTIATNADWIKTNVPTLRGSRVNLWTNENEYFNTSASAQFRCANNMLRDLHNLVYGRAPCVMPIIHMVKQLGQSSADSNTEGYGLLKARLPAPYGQAPGSAGDTDPGIDYGTFGVVAANYNSWLLVGENVTVGAVRVGGTPALPGGIGFAAFLYAGKMLYLVVNRNSYAVTVSVPLGSTQTLAGKRYNATTAGVSIGSVTQSIFNVTVPAYSGEAWSQ